MKRKYIFASALILSCLLAGCEYAVDPIETTAVNTPSNSAEPAIIKATPKETDSISAEITKEEEVTKEEESMEEKRNVNPKLAEALKRHDETKDTIAKLNGKAEKRDFVYWGTGLTAKEERDMILEMNEDFKKAVIQKTVERYGAKPSRIEINDETYEFDGNFYSVILEAGRAGAIKMEDAELYILAESLWTDNLRGQLKAELMPQIIRYIKERYPDRLGLYKYPRHDRASLKMGRIGGSPVMNAMGASATLDSLDSSFMMEEAEADGVLYEAGMMYDEMPDFNTSEYNVIRENGFKSVKASPLSTFSIDVDTAGYTKVKYDILQGNEIVKDEVKLEELINYFDFDYTADRVKDDPFIVSTEYTACPWNKEHQLLRIGIKADDVERPDTNFVLVADVSGSMLSLNKLPLALNAYAEMVKGFDANDKISIMYYASSDGVLMDGVSCEDKEKIYDGLAELLFVAGGGTYGEAGLNTAYNMARKSFIDGGVNRVLIATDGDFNIGRTSSTEMKALVENGMKDGIYLTILGYGFENLKDNKMETMAENGHGNYYYIGDIADAKKALVEEANSTLIPVADDVKIQVEFNPSVVQEYRLLGYESRLLNAEDFNNDKVTASQIGAGESVTVLYELVPVKAESVTSTPELKYSSVQPNGLDDVCTVSVRYKGINSAVTGAASDLIEREVSSKDFAEIPDDNTALAISVAEYGMVLRNSEFKGTSSLSNAKAIAEAVSQNDSVKSYIELVEKLIKQSK